MSKRTINMIFKMDETQIVNFENWFRQQEEVIDFKILPDTDHLKDNKTFKKLYQTEKKAKDAKYDFINRNRS